MDRPVVALKVLSADYGSSGVPDDVLLGVQVETGTFRGEIDTWVLGVAMNAFIEQLRRLYDTLGGHAVVESISPGEFWLRISREDAAGHIRVDGRVAVRGVRYGWREFDTTLEFGARWEFEQLRQLADGLATQIRAARC